MQICVVVFPGSNCDHDIFYTYSKQGAEVKTVWHRDNNLPKCDLVVVPGGFSYGDYLRTGALAKISPIMNAIRDFAAAGGNVLGICNGFQILCEAELLPGLLLQNIGRRFLSQFVHLKPVNCHTFFTKQLSQDTILTCPIAHFEGNYFADADTIKQLEDNNQIVFRYCTIDGEVMPGDRLANPNGSINAIAGICNRAGNVVGLMPHPERVFDRLVEHIADNSVQPVFTI